MLGESMSKSVAAAASAPKAKSLARNKNLKKNDKVQPADEVQAVHHDEAPTHLAQAHEEGVITVSDTVIAVSDASLEGDFSFSQVLADAQASEASFYTDAGASMGGAVSFLQDDTMDGGSGSGSGVSTALLVGGGLLAAGGVVAAVSGGDDDDDNTAPAATAGKATGAEDTVITGKATATDADGDTLTWAGKGTLPAGVTVAADGTVKLDAANAAYQSLAAGKSQDVVANVTVSDGNGGTADTTVTFTVTGVNDDPTFAAAKQDLTTKENVALSGTATATDPDAGDTLTYAIGTQGANGTAAIGADGKFTYTPTANFDGTDTFTVTATDATGATATQTINVTVENVGPTSAAVTLDATSDGKAVDDADNVNTTYTVQTGDYSFTINGFDAGGDKLVGPAGTTPTVINSDFTDGEVTVQWAIDGNNIVQVTLADLTVAQDQQIFGLTSLNNTLGAGTIA